jgi:pimeloyl-ACP methyl ester carboxylesterase
MDVMRSLTIDARGPVHVADFGGSGPTLLLIHGLGGSYLNWLSVAPMLADDHRVFAVDLPGFGLSRAAGRRSTVSANLGAVVRTIGSLASRPVILMGNSMGGLLSLALSATHPELVAGQVLVDPALSRPRGQRVSLDPFLRQYLLLYLPSLAVWQLGLIARRAGAEVIVRRVLTDCTVDLERIDPAVFEAHVEFERRRIEEDSWREPLRDAVHSLLRLMTERERIEGWIRQTTVPTLLMHGVADRVVPFRSAAAAADLRPDWEFHALEDVGHVPMMEAPDRVVRSMRRWERRQAWYPVVARQPAALVG